MKKVKNCIRTYFTEKKTTAVHSKYTFTLNYVKDITSVSLSLLPEVYVNQTGLNVGLQVLNHDNSDTVA